MDKSVEEEIDRKQKLVEKILEDLVKTFQENLYQLQDSKDIESIDDLQPIVSSSAMAFFAFVNSHILETMHNKMKIDFLTFMRKQTNGFFDDRINEIKLH